MSDGFHRNWMVFQDLEINGACNKDMDGSVFLIFLNRKKLTDTGFSTSGFSKDLWFWFFEDRI